jgi:hypothetical protein
VGGDPDDLTPPDRVGAPVAAILEHDHDPVVGLDESTHIHLERAIDPATRMIRGAEGAGDRPLCSSLGEVEVLLLLALGSIE